MYFISFFGGGDGEKHLKETTFVLLILIKDIFLGQMLLLLGVNILPTCNRIPNINSVL